MNTPYEENNWLTKSVAKERARYMSSDLFEIDNSGLINNKFYGLVKYAGRVDVKKLLSSFRNYCINNGKLVESDFQYNNLKITGDKIIYNKIQSKKIIFCEGNSIQKNPYFNYLTLKPTKGEILNICVPDLKIEKIIHSKFLFVPLGNNIYSVGATYNWESNNDITTKNAKQKITSVLDSILSFDYSIIEHRAGIRPSTLDRRPLVGAHPEYKNMYILNGLGTRGVLMSPYLSSNLFHTIYHNKPLDKEADINRFQ